MHPPSDVPSALAMCRIKSRRKFELQELTQIFFGNVVGAVMWVVSMAEATLANWALIQIAAGAWATNLPINGGIFTVCTEEDFRLRVHPHGECWNNYTICVVLFGCIVSLLSYFELQEIHILTVTISVCRYVSYVAMIIHALVIVSTGNQKHTDSIPWLGFSPRGWLAASSVFVFGQAIQFGIPTIGQVVPRKRRLPRMFMSVVISAILVYAILGVVVAICFGSNINEMSNLNWLLYTGGDNHLVVRVIAYYIVLFPSADSILTFLYQTTILTNVAESWIFGGYEQLSRLTRVTHRFIAALIPLIGAIFVTNLVTAMRYISLTVIFMFVLMPTVLQYRSRKVWLQKLKSLQLSVINTADCNGSGSAVSVAVDSPSESDSLIAQGSVPDFTFERDTPYSGWYSKPWVVVMFLLYSASLTVIIISGLALPV